MASRMAWKIGRDGEECAVGGDGMEGAVREGGAAVGSVGGRRR